jgi:hypothetical protein
MICADWLPEPSMAQNVDRHLARLTKRYPLPNGLGEPEVFAEVVQIHAVSIQVAGVATMVDGECITGSAGSLVEPPLKRAYLELLERLAVLNAIARTDATVPVWDESGASRGAEPRSAVFPQPPVVSSWCWARSNGVAVGGTWDDAARRARLELIERDRVLRSWYGEDTPTRIAVGDDFIPGALRASYEFEAYEFGGGSGSVAVGVFGFPRNDEPLVYGFGARANLLDATTSAASECLQRLAFLWGEALPDAPPAFAPTPAFHQEHYLYAGNREGLRRWLCGGHRSFCGILGAMPEPAEPSYVDLTPVALASRLRVVKAIAAGHVPLTFGRGHPLLQGEAPEELAVHPIV